MKSFLKPLAAAALLGKLTPVPSGCEPSSQEAMTTVLGFSSAAQIDAESQETSLTCTT